MRHPWRWIIGISTVAIAALWALLLPVDIAEPTQDTITRPKLVVMVVFDQMRGDYIKKWEPLFGDGGFKRLQSEGAWFTNCHYPYAYTLTAAGHTSLVTGTTPSRHGVIANDWYDRIHREPIASTTPPPDERVKGPGPYRRKVESVGDVLLRVLQGRGRVASLSIKERAAILMAALRAQICYWFNPADGRFGTSRFYRDDPHSWVTAFNKKRFADQWLAKNWDRFRPNLDYVKHSGPDDFISEGTGYLQGRKFPHPFKVAETEDPKENAQNYYDAVTNSPMGNDLLLEFAKATINAEKLGQSDSTDLLFISFTSNDYVGHTWGPDSQEVLDVTLRSDALMKDLLGFLDDKVGKGNYYLAMSADHGVCPLPEFAEKAGKTTGRVDPALLSSKAEDFLNKRFLKEGEKAPWLEELRRSTAWIYLNRETIKELKLKHEDVESALARWYAEQPGVAKAFTRTEMMREDTKERSPLEKQMGLSFHPDCSGDVMLVLKPYHIFSPPNIVETPKKNPTYRATHGAPYEYDTHVPLLVMGPRIVPGVREQRVAPQAMASILAEALRVPAPKDATYAIPMGLFGK